MAESIQHIAEKVKASLSEDLESGRWQLMEFARDFAYNETLRYSAVFLNMNYSKANNQVKKQEIGRQMTELVDGILKDYSLHKYDLSFNNQLTEKLEESLSDKRKDPKVLFFCKNLGFSYAKSGFKIAQINVSLNEGEIIGIVGKNGEGKTTLLKLIAGQLFHTDGEIGFPLFQKPENDKLKWFNILKEVAYIPQELMKWKGSLKANIQYEASVHGIKGKYNEREVNFIIERLGLSEYLNQRWDKLSGGFKLRFALAKALVWKPKLLILDEPLANLDIDSQQIVLYDLKTLANSLKFPISIVISSQHLHEIETISDKILFLREGKPVFYGNADEIGAEFKDNVFELESSVSLKELRDGLPGMSISYNGNYFIIRTSSDIDSVKLLRMLIELNVSVKYFRDISGSVKRLFD